MEDSRPQAILKFHRLSSLDYRVRHELPVKNEGPTTVLQRMTKWPGVEFQVFFRSPTLTADNFEACLRSVAGLVIQATGRTEFEDGLRTGVHLGDCWCPWGGRTYPRINFKPLWGCGLVLGWVWLSEGPHFRPNSNLLGSAHWWY